MGEQVVGLEDHADVATDPVRVDAVVGEVVVEERDRTRVDALEEVAASEQGRLARSRRADQARHLVGPQFERDVLEDEEVVEGFPDALDGQDDAARFLRHTGEVAHDEPASRRARSRATIRSV